MTKVNFTILENLGTKNTLECPECRQVFDIDAMTDLNLVWDRQLVMYVAKCPKCGVEQE
jgi:C4-type Zn-finger protein